MGVEAETFQYGEVMGEEVFYRYDLRLLLCLSIWRPLGMGFVHEAIRWSLVITLDRLPPCYWAKDGGNVCCYKMFLFIYLPIYLPIQNSMA